MLPKFKLVKKDNSFVVTALDGAVVIRPTFEGGEQE